GGTLLDLGASDGETLGHIAQLRPDLRLLAADKFRQPEKYPAGCEFRQADFEREPLPWPAATVDAITCMHLVEHLSDLGLLLREIARVLKPDGRVYFETPHAKTLTLPSRRQAPQPFTMNFYDDPTHVQVVTMAALAPQVQAAGLRVERTGTSRNWLFAASHPLFALLPASRKKFTAHVHWLGWSACLIAARPA
ncbi:MAG: class I SAM-dependent methyltransferase, partial [Verrucomicrobia bacterium]|nr:class I SAM-dependent methyltransferase [Verrucomicrobiota bacterium]